MCWRLNRVRQGVFVSVALPALFASAFAQEEEKDDQTVADEIIVTAARTSLPANALPLTIDIIDAEALAQQAAISGSVIDAISTLTPSFSPTRQKLSGAGESLRGRAPLFAINGVPQTTPLRDGSRDGFTIDPFFVDRVEIIFGSNALQGIGGTGGIINQVTAGAPSVDGWSGRVLLQGTADTRFNGDGLGWKAAALSSWRGGAFDATFGAAFEERGAFFDGDGRIVGVDGTQGELQDSDNLSFYSRFGADLGGDARLDVIGSRFRLEGNGGYVTVAGNRLTGLPTSAVRGDQPGEPPANLAESVQVTLTDASLAGGDFVSQVFWSRTRDTFGGGVFPDFQDPALPPFGSLFDQSENRSRKLGAKLSYERAVPGFEALTATLGFDALFDRTAQVLIATDRVWVPQTDFRSLAPFGQLNLGLLDDRLRFAGGARWENVEIAIPDFTTLAFYGPQNVAGGSPKFSDALLNGGVILEPVEGVRYYASYAEGYTVPDVGRITRAVSVPNIDIDTFLDISPIVSNNIEVGAEVKKGPIDASIAYFWSSSDRGQLLVLINDVFEVQRQRVEIEGLEINVNTQTPVRGLVLSAGYAMLDGETDSNGDDVVDIDLDGANISPDRINAAANFARGPVVARLQSQFYLARDFFGADPRNSFEGYTLVDATIRYDTGFGGITLSAANLLDEQYISYNSDTTRPTDNLRFFAGRGRSITLGWDFSF
jgi:iron complex outermembrane receptor protein